MRLERNTLKARALQQWTPGIQLTWTPPAVKRALYEHQRGRFQQVSKMANAMLTDDEYSGSLERAIEAIVGAPFCVAAEENREGESDQRSEDLANELEQIWYELAPESQLVQMMRWYMQIGVSVGTLDWRTESGVWVPRLRTLSPEFLEHRPDELNHAKMHGKWVYYVRDGVEEEVIPGNGRWVLFADGGQDSWLSCGVRALGDTWLGKALTWRDWLRYNERHGLPIVKAMAPAVSGAKEKEQFGEDVRSIGSDTTVLLPTHIDEDGAAFDLELLEATDGSWESFKTTIERCDRKFQVYFLGSNAGSELVGSVGSRAAAEASQDSTRALASARARRIATMLREQLFGPYAQANVANPPVLPWPQWEIDPKETIESRGVALKALGDALVSIKSAGYTVSNLSTLLADSGIELEESEGMEPEEPGEGSDDEEERGESLAELADDPDDRSEMAAAQEYIDGLSEHMASIADELEGVSAEDIGTMLSESSSPDDLKSRLKEYVKTDDPIMLGRAYEKVILLAHYAGTLAAESDG